MAIAPPILTLVASFFLWLSCGVRVHASNTPHLVQSFFFDYNLPSQPVPVPVTTQCDTIHITWGRSAATGPNPTAPYYLQVYASTFVFPFIIDAGSGLSFDWAVPFAPGTQYQICMVKFDRNGNTGGCQATYTVIPRSSPASCPNVTFPAAPLDVEAVVENGPMSQYGWINQCTDISVTPKNGTPPYTFTAAPALHPPYNISSPDMKSINWTVSLSWAAPFFISVADSAGNFWSNGPLHSGGDGPTNCLAGDTTSPRTKILPSVTAGVGVGGFVVGALGGIIVAYIFMQRLRRNERRRHFMDLSSGSPQVGSPIVGAFDHSSGTPASHYRAVPTTHPDSSLASSNPSSTTMLNRITGTGSTQYQIEPFVMPTEDGQIRATRHPSTIRDSASHHPPTSPRESHSHSTIPQGQVYVVHHDGGRAPVSVYHQDGTEVVELPPRYIGSEPSGSGSNDVRSDLQSDGRSEGFSSGSDGRTDGGRTDTTEQPPFLRQQRRPNSANKPRNTSFTGRST